MIIADTVATRTQDPPRAAHLFSRRAIGWLAFWCSAPMGLILLGFNWDVAGQPRRGTRYWAAAAVTTLAITALGLTRWPFVTLASFVLFNVLPLPFLLNRAAECERAALASSNDPDRQNAWLAIALALGFLVAAGVLNMAATAIFAKIGA